MVGRWRCPFGKARFWEEGISCVYFSLVGDFLTDSTMETHHLGILPEPPQEGLNVVFLAAVFFVVWHILTWHRCGLQGRWRWCFARGVGFVWFCAIKNAWSSAFARVKEKQWMSSFAQESQPMRCTKNAIYLDMMCLFLSKPAKFISAIKNR